MKENIKTIQWICRETIMQEVVSDQGQRKAVKIHSHEVQVKSSYENISDT